MGFLSNILMHPEMLAAGAAAISIPVIIHLLNRRRFKEIDWAAMEFLLEAEQKNRRRVQLEHLLLLLLRCLTMLLLGALIARPFLPANLGAMLFDTQQYERIVLLDDSLSTRTRVGNRTAFELAREKLVELVQTLSTDETDDAMTLLLASRPGDPVAAAKPVTAENVSEWVDQINELEPSDLAIDLGAGLAEVDRYLGEPRQDLNRVVYVLSDLMERDWQTRRAGDDATLPHQILKQISEKVAGCFVVDIGVEAGGNLSVESVVTSEPPIEGVPIRVDVRVRNHGVSEARNVRLQLFVGDSLPIEETLDEIPAGETREVGFPVTFPRTLESFAVDDEGERIEPLAAIPATSIPIRAVIVADDPSSDSLAEDSLGYHSALVMQGLPILIVDGDPTPDPLRSETIFLRRALAPPGEQTSGNLVDVVPYTELDNVPLSRYRVVMLCNVDQLSPNSLETVETWVRDGGGLVLFPGDRTRPALYEEQLFRAGQGLSPIGLVDIQGDSQREKWSSLEISETPHQVLRVFAGVDNQLVDRVKFFSWWRGKLAEPPSPDVNVLARLDDAENSVAIAEKNVGKGHVIAFVVPADADWTNWPEEGLSYLLVSLDLASYLSGATLGAADLRVGSPIQETVDLAFIQRQATLQDPADERHDLVARPYDPQAVEADGTNPESVRTTMPTETPESASSADETAAEADELAADAAGQERSGAAYRFVFPGTRRAGFHRLSLVSTDNRPIERWYAANVEPEECNLTRLDPSEARQSLFGEKVVLIERDRLAVQTVEGGRRELWRWLILVLIAGLVVEQSLARWFRARR